jgi:hypothetical protein
MEKKKTTVATKYIKLCMTTRFFYKTTKIIDDILRFFERRKRKTEKIIVPAFSHAALNRVCVTQCTKKLLRYSHNNQFKLQSLNDDYLKNRIIGYVNDSFFFKLPALPHSESSYYYLLRNFGPLALPTPF